MCLKCCLQPWLESYFLRQFSVSCVQQLQSFLSCQIRLTESPHLYRKMPLDFKIEFAVLTPSTQWQWTRFSELKCFLCCKNMWLKATLLAQPKQVEESEIQRQCPYISMDTSSKWRPKKSLPWLPYDHWSLLDMVCFNGLIHLRVLVEVAGHAGTSKKHL